LCGSLGICGPAAFLENVFREFLESLRAAALGCVGGSALLGTALKVARTEGLVGLPPSEV